MGNLRHINWEHIEWSRKFKQLLNDILYTKKIYVNSLANQLGVRADTAYKWVNPENPFNNFPAFLLPEFTKKIGKEILEYLANQSGYLLCPKPTIDGKVDAKALQLVSHALKESTECLNKFIEVIADAKVTEAEYKQFEKEYNDAMTALTKLKLMVEALRIK
ncbi:MAG TPA: hypothetical protein ENF30_02025 [Candidatus Desulfofervidus auxilii]|uniref:Uncharacterized protein n=1 Tax=Desulfofervidus auxilii TaxID=1621989 RepID=A0A7V0NES8_DESA2|nr:hypothetical protein [Candidatus Desulfofervidus auxilii]